MKLLRVSALMVSGFCLLASPFFLLPSAFAAVQAPPPAADLARQLQTHYNGVRDFTADFTHQYRGGALRQTLTERGQVRIKKPGRMDWLYTSPEKKEFMSDGTKLDPYFPSEKMVMINDLPTGDQAPTALLFLAGRGDLVRDFRPALPTTQPDGLWQLDLLPKTAQTDFTTLSMTVDPRTMALRGLTSTDAQDGLSTFTFSNLRENVGLADNQFQFKIPRGVDVRR